MAVKKASAADVKALAAKRAKKLGLSYTKPDSALTPAQLKNRKAIQTARANDRNPLYDPSQALTGNTLAKTVDQLTDATFAPQERQANQSIQNVGTQYDALQGRAQGYYGQVAARDTASSARQAALSKMLSDRLGQVATDSANTVQGYRSDELARSQADQAVRGGGPSSTTELDVAGTRAAGQTAALQSAGALQNANQEALQGDLAAARQIKGGEIQDQLSTRRANDLLKQQGVLQDLAKARAQFKTDKTLSLRDQAFTNALAQETLGVKNDQIAASVENNKRSTATSRENTTARIESQENQTAARLTTQKEIAQANRDASKEAHATGGDEKFLLKYGMSKQAFLKLPAAQRAKLVQSKSRAAAGEKPLTPLQVKTIAGHVKGARADAASLMSKPGANSSEVRELLRRGATGQKYTVDEINAAFDLLPPALGGRGGLSPANITALGPEIAKLFPRAKKRPGVVLPIVGRVGAG